MVEISETPKEKKHTVLEASALQQQAVTETKKEHYEPILHYADIGTREKVTNAHDNFTKDSTMENYQLLQKELSNCLQQVQVNNPNEYNKLVKEYKAPESASPERLAAEIIGDSTDWNTKLHGLMEEKNKCDKVGDEKGSQKIQVVIDGMYGLKDKEETDELLQKNKSKLIELGMTDIAAAIGRVQEKAREGWEALSKLKMPLMIKQLVPEKIVKKAAEYAQKLIENIDKYFKEYMAKSEKMLNEKGMSDEEKKAAVEEIEAARKAKEELGDKEVDEKIFEKHLKKELNEVQKVLEDKGALESVKKMNSNASELKPSELMLENMHPSVMMAVLKAYRGAAVDTKQAVA